MQSRISILEQHHEGIMQEMTKLQSKVWEMTRVGMLLVQSIPKQSHYGDALRKNDRRTPQIATFVRVCQGVPNLMQEDGCANLSVTSKHDDVCASTGANSSRASNSMQDK